MIVGMKLLPLGPDPCIREAPVLYEDDRRLRMGCAELLDERRAFLPDIAKDVWGMVENRVLSTLALLATAAFTWHARSIQDIAGLQHGWLRSA